MALVIMFGVRVTAAVLPILAGVRCIAEAVVSTFALRRILLDFIDGLSVDRISPRFVAVG